MRYDQRPESDNEREDLGVAIWLAIAIVGVAILFGMFANHKSERRLPVIGNHPSR